MFNTCEKDKPILNYRSPQLFQGRVSVHEGSLLLEATLASKAAGSEKLHGVSWGLKIKGRLASCSWRSALFLRWAVSKTGSPYL